MKCLKHEHCYWAVMLILVLFTACNKQQPKTTPSAESVRARLTQLKEGMTVKEVERILELPKASQWYGNNHFAQYLLSSNRCLYLYFTERGFYFARLDFEYVRNRIPFLVAGMSPEEAESALGVKQWDSGGGSSSTYTFDYTFEETNQQHFIVLAFDHSGYGPDSILPTNFWLKWVQVDDVGWIRVSKQGQTRFIPNDVHIVPSFPGSQ